MIYRSSPIKRSRRTKDQIEQLESQIVSCLSDDHPQSVRHVFYRMTDPRLPESVAKTDKGSNNGYRAVQDRVVKLRRAGSLPYWWITDATRRGHYVDTYAGASDFLQRVKGLYRADLWEHTEYLCEVWTESRSIAGVIETDCRELAVSLYPAGGFSSITLAFQAAEMINQTALGRDVVIFYIGDYDPAGVLIDVALERELRKHLSPSISLHFERIGITKQQIAEFDLPTKPRKQTDRRSQHIRETVEAEAMPAWLLRSILRDRIEALLPAGALAAAKVAEASEREHLGKMAELLGGAV